MDIVVHFLKVVKENRVPKAQWAPPGLQASQPSGVSQAPLVSPGKPGPMALRESVDSQGYRERRACLVHQG